MNVEFHSLVRVTPRQSSPEPLFRPQIKVLSITSEFGEESLTAFHSCSSGQEVDEVSGCGGSRRVMNVIYTPDRTRPDVCKAFLGLKVLHKISSILLVRG